MSAMFPPEDDPWSLWAHHPPVRLDRTELDRLYKARVASFARIF